MNMRRACPCFGYSCSWPRIACSGRGLLGIHRQVRLERQLSGDLRSISRPALDLDRPAHGLDAVGETYQARTARRIGPADAVVADRQLQAAVARRERHLDPRGVRMLRSVGQGLARNVVRREVDMLRVVDDLPVTVAAASHSDVRAVEHRIRAPGKPACVRGDAGGKQRRSTQPPRGVRR